jgi:anti-sigma B factor antagonist
MTKADVREFMLTKSTGDRRPSPDPPIAPNTPKSPWKAGRRLPVFERCGYCSPPAIPYDGIPWTVADRRPPSPGWLRKAPSGPPPRRRRRSTPVMSQAKKRRIEVEEVDDVSVVEFVDKRILDEQNIQLIGDQLFELVDDLGKKKLLLNFANVEYLSSAALGKLMTLNKKVKAAAGELRLCNIKPEIKEVFSITKLDKMLRIFDTEQDALERF